MISHSLWVAFNTLAQNKEIYDLRSWGFLCFWGKRQSLPLWKEK